MIKKLIFICVDIKPKTNQIKAVFTHFLALIHTRLPKPRRKARKSQINGQSGQIMRGSPESFCRGWEISLSLRRYENTTGQNNQRGTGRNLGNYYGTFSGLENGLFDRPRNG
jgi:hypothetical protein